MRFLRMLYRASAGIAMANPISVVNRAVEIPRAKSDGLGVVGELAITLNELIIPCTVPNNRSWG